MSGVIVIVIVTVSRFPGSKMSNELSAMSDH